jgi:sulfur relay (sulfurtransferase) DsrC/TusE family protein
MKSGIVDSNYALKLFEDGTKPSLDENDVLWRIKDKDVTMGHEAVMTYVNELYHEYQLQFQERVKAIQKKKDEEEAKRKHLVTFDMEINNWLGRKDEELSEVQLELKRHKNILASVDSRKRLRTYVKKGNNLLEHPGVKHIKYETRKEIESAITTVQKQIDRLALQEEYQL